MQTPQSLSEAIQFVKKIGFHTDLTWDEDCLYCSMEHIHFAPHEFEIVQHIIVPSESNPQSNVHILALTSRSYQMKGYLVSDQATLAYYPFSQHLHR